MRINKFLAQATGLSRRAADKAVTAGQVSVNGQSANLGYALKDGDKVLFDGKLLAQPKQLTTIMLNKPVGYVCSRNGQGSKTVYDLLPAEFHNLKPVGRLDKDSSGLLLLTNDGKLANELTHPRYAKQKVYELSLNQALLPADKQKIEAGIKLDDGISKLKIRGMRHEARGMRKNHSSYLLTRNSAYEVRMSEGRNRQVRRTFAALGYKVTLLHRTKFGKYSLKALEPGRYTFIE